jgi:uncharacterized membrane protein YkoI
MKTHRIRFMALALAGGALVGATYADKVSFEQLPLEVKDKIRAHTGAAAVEDVDRQSKGGQTTYEVAFKKDGKHTELLFDEKGQLLTDAQGAAPDSRKISYNELPEAVKRVADTRVRGAEVNDVDRQVKNGQTTYEIGFKQNGQQQELVISQDGRIMNDVALSQNQAVGAPAPVVTGTATSTTTPSTEPLMLSSASRVELTAVPVVVQKVITAASKGAPIEDLERGTYQGQNVYQAAFKENGRHMELQVREDGTILYDPRTPANVPGRRIRWGSRAGESALYRDVKSAVTLSSAQKVERNALPVTLQRRLNAHTGNRPIEDIERGTWQGKTVYEVAFKDEAGKHIELQLDENGVVVYDPRTPR